MAGALVPSRTSCLVVVGDILLSSPAHPGSSGRLPAPGVPIPGLRPSKLFPQPPPPIASFPTRAPSQLPLQSCQCLAKTQVRAFDPGFRARGQDSLPYLGRLLWAPNWQLEPLVRLNPVPASLAACGRRGSAATSPHVAQPMGGSCSGQANTAAVRVTPSHSCLRCCLRREDGVFDKG